MRVLVNQGILKTYQGLGKEAYILFASQVANSMGSFIGPLATLIFSQKLGLEEDEVGLLLTLFMLVRLPMGAIGGKLVDQYGAKKILLPSLVIGGFFYIVSILIPVKAWIPVLVIGAGAIYSIGEPASNVLVPEVVQEKDIKRMYSFLYFGMNIGMSISAVIGGLLLNNYLQILFLLDALTTFLTAFLIWRYIGKSSGIVEEEEKIRGKSEVTILENEKTVDNPFKKEVGQVNNLLQFFRIYPTLLVFLGLELIYSFSYAQWSYLLPLHNVAIFKDQGAIHYSMLLSINTLQVVFMTPLLTSLTRKLDSLRCLAMNGAFFALSFLVFAFSKSALLFVLGTILLTLGEILSAINLGNFLAGAVPKTYLGRLNGAYMFVAGVGSALGPLVVGSFLTYYTYKKVWIVLMCIAFLAALGMYGLSRYEKLEKDRQVEMD